MPSNLKQLTALRFFAAAWVVLYGWWPLLRPTAAAPAVLARGYLGVELFFVLSGFILSHVYTESLGAGRFRYGGFLWARLARIYPLHLATLLAIGAMAAAAALAHVPMEHDIASWTALPANLTLTQAWGLAPDASWNHPSWSISAEWAAYLAFPLCAAAAWRLRARPGVALAGSLALLFVSYALFARVAGRELTHATIAGGALRVFPPFLYGCALHVAWRGRTAPPAREAALTAFLFTVLLVVAVLLGAADAVVVAAGGGLILALAGMAGAGSKRLSSPAWVWLGEVSFALYMVKTPWELLGGNLLKRGLHLPDNAPWPLAPWLLFCLLALPLAALAHHLVERPARVALRRAGHLWPRRPREEAASSL